MPTFCRTNDLIENVGFAFDELNMYKQNFGITTKVWIL
jgi:hypothetical protein